MMLYPIYMPQYPTYEPQWHKIFTLPSQPVASVEVSESSTFQCAVELVYKRKYVDLYTKVYNVYLPDSDELVVKLQPALGQSRRNPEKFVAVVVPADTRKARVFRTVEIKSSVKLTVEG